MMKCLINTKRPKDIINKAERGLVRERVRLVNNKLDNLKEERSGLEQDLKEKIPADSELGQQISSHLTEFASQNVAKWKSCRIWKTEENLPREFPI